MASQTSTSLRLTILMVLFAGVFARNTPDWDYITFSQGWPQTRCIEQNVTEDHTCAIPKDVNTWIIHGVWPSKGAHKGPENCNTSYPFNPSEIQDLLIQMKIAWPNLFTDSPMDSFWQHEWDTHGTCAMNLAAMSNEHDYFKEGLQLGSKFNLYNLLKNGGIVPLDDKPYKLATIMNVIEKQLHVSVEVECFWNKKERKPYLGEIHVCLTKSFKPIDCPSDGYLRFERCSKNDDVYYPVIVH